MTRLWFDRPLDGTGRSVIVKTRRVEDDSYGGPAYLRREQVGLQLARPAGVTPRVLAADHEAGIVVLSDAGPARTLDAVLRDDDADAARNALKAAAVAVARVHRATAGLREEFVRTTRDVHPAASPDPTRPWPWTGVDRWDLVEQATADLGLPPAREASEDAAAVLDRLQNPGPFAALVHADLNPTNILVTADGAVRLIDFEGSLFGHIGLDVCYFHYPFPAWSGYWAVLPEAVVDAVDAAYRETLLSDQPPFDRAAYDEMLTFGAAALLAVRLQRLPRIAENGQPRELSWRRRGQMIQQLDVFARLAGRTGHLLALAGFAERLRAAMAARWPDATSPPPRLFPAFGG